MPVKVKHNLTIFCSVTFILMFCNQTYSQGLFDKLVNKAEKILSPKIDKSIDNAISRGVNSITKQTGAVNNQNGQRTNGRPNLSELKDEEFNQNDANPQLNQENTRFQIAKNLMIDIKGKYPAGYLPRWRFVNYSSALKFSREDWLNPKSNLYYENKVISIGDYGGKAVMRFKPHFDCECYADIVVKDSFSVIAEKPKVFEIGNFRKILNERSTGEPCIGGLSVSKGGWGGKVALSANPNGDILMDLMLEEYTGSRQDRKGFRPSQVHYRFHAKGITVENEMSAEKAIAIIAAEQEAKQRQKDYIAKTSRQADSLQKLIAKKYPQKQCRECFYSSRGNYISSNRVDEYYVVSGRYYGSRTEYDVNTVIDIKNKCNFNIMFVGIQQLQDKEGRYYLVEVTKTMEKGYSYSSDQGIVSSIFSSLIGVGSEFNFSVQDKYEVKYASVGAVQWLKVIKSK